MKNLFTTTNFNEMKAKATELNIKWVGVKKDQLLIDINTKLAELAETNKEKKTTAKWYDGNNEFQAGDVIQINETTMKKGDTKKTILKDRMAEVVGFSRTPGKLRVILYNDQGELQNCTITVEIENVVLSPEYRVA